MSEARGELQELEVKEWALEDGNHPKIYYYSKPNVAEFLRITNALPANVERQDYRVIVEVFQVMALNKDGKRLFSDVDTDNLYSKYDPDVIGRLVGRMGVLDHIFERSMGDPDDLGK